ncbi:MAG TPA: histidinol dehydrogenase [Bacteroidia bacterium]|jgi:histidinol dehydrogenase|nr:histidinol dehydrogenase [Bacteroidia bacterium]
MKTIKFPERREYDNLLRRPVAETASLETLVAGILSDVKLQGDAALKLYGLQFDKVQISRFEVEETEFEKAEGLVPEKLKNAIRFAAENIRRFHAAQKESGQTVETVPGVTCWRKSVPVSSVGLYIPGGSAPLFSTILMLGIPAMLAGCGEVVMCTPPMPDGTVNPAMLFAARLVGIRKVFRVGGVQAIGAMAYGTESIPRVHKIFGPGNGYVTCAKQLISKEGIAIDLPAGPSELAVLADKSCVPAFVAADLLSQAEHGPDSQVILVTDSEKVIEDVMKQLGEQLELLPRKELAAQALRNSKAILVKGMEEGMYLLNSYAPEHLIIACRNDQVLAAQVVNAGSVFLGNYACESAGDYASGTNHTLPTNGAAKAYSGVSLDSFVKKITFQSITKEGIQNLGRAIELMAEAEGLEGHRNAVSVRLAD